MRAKIIIVVTLFTVFYSFLANANDWSRKDTYWQLSVTALMVADWGQTRYIASNPERFMEYNPIIGEYPDKKRVDLYFATAIITHATISYLLPSKLIVFEKEINPRRIWQGITVGIEVGCVANNARIGIGFEF